MTRTPEQEAEAASAAYHVALTQIGATTVEEALKLWAAVPPNRTAATSAAWLKRAVQLVMGRRGQARDLAMAYYRLTRALRTGTTIADPRKPDPPYVTLEMLRREFSALATPEKPQEGTGKPAPARDTGAPPRGAQDTQAAPRDTSSGDGKPVERRHAEFIPVERIPDLKQSQDRLERAAQQEAQVVLQVLGPQNLDKKVKEIDPQAPATEVDKAREEAHKQAGARQAAAAERVVMDGARGTVWNAAQRDRRVIGYIRVSRTGTPCGWCAMLISRGAVYKTERGATYADGDKYHDNCHCMALPVYSRDEYTKSDQYALNREYQKLWPKVTNGLSGKAAVSAWRRFIRLQQADAQAARRSQDVQEA